jgi:hypothetical protein
MKMKRKTLVTTLPPNLNVSSSIISCILSHSTKNYSALNYSMMKEGATRDIGTFKQGVTCHTHQASLWLANSLTNRCLGGLAIYTIVLKFH